MSRTARKPTAAPPEPPPEPGEIDRQLADASDHLLGLSARLAALDNLLAYPCLSRENEELVARVAGRLRDLLRNAGGIARSPSVTWTLDDQDEIQRSMRCSA